ncbi:hypothetical protein E2320_002436 [Naja naja]|nr:hypothetical protein E2320_002436 [Naja naja]
MSTHQGRPHPQMALDEAQATEMSNQSTVEIQGASSPSAARRTITMHHDEVDPEEVAEEEDDINHLWSEMGKDWASKIKPWQLQTACMGCGSNQL